ncbi:MAG: response regulator [Desulfobacterales bacterium]|nr:response regulator [Desulfobacterales bacterium]
MKGKAILVVDDEPDVLDTVEEVLDMCLVYKAPDYNSAIQLLLGLTYDVVILDIMGVNGFELLKIAVRRGFPTVMLTAHALTTEALKNSIKLGAVSFLPKDKVLDLPYFLENVVLGGGRPVWKKLFVRLESHFSERFGKDWKEKDKFLKEFIESLKTEETE